jgi:hypothetical protein
MKRTWFILKFNNIEAKQTGSIVILYLKSRKKNFCFFLMKGKKRKCLIMNYQSFAIPSLPNYGTSEAVNLCSRYIEKSPTCSELNSPVILENKIICSLTVTCASSFLSSHRSHRLKNMQEAATWSISRFLSAESSLA